MKFLLFAFLFTGCAEKKLVAEIHYNTGRGWQGFRTKPQAWDVREQCERMVSETIQLLSIGHDSINIDSTYCGFEEDLK